MIAFHGVAGSDSSSSGEMPFTASPISISLMRTASKTIGVSQPLASYLWIVATAARISRIRFGRSDSQRACLSQHSLSHRGPQAVGRPDVDSNAKDLTQLLLQTDHGQQ